LSALIALFAFLLFQDETFIYLAIFLLSIGLIIVWRFSKEIKININDLQLLIDSTRKNNKLTNNFQFPQNELDEISEDLVNLCTDLIQTKEQLNTEKQKFAYHLQSANEGVAMFSEDFNCIISNLKFIELSNSVLKKVISTPNDFFHSSQKNIVVDALNSNVKSWIIEGNNKIVQANLLKFKDNSFELILNDITKGEVVNRFKKEITDNLSHELKTPLCSIQGYLESIITRPNISEEQKNNFLNKAFEQSQRMTNLVNAISKVTRISQAKDYFEFEKINVLEIIEKCIDASNQQIAEKNIKIELNIAQNLIIKANEELFYSIFSNLISNSINYAGEDFTVGISCKIVGKNYISFVYYDTGKGVEEKHLNRIFERFYRIDKGRTQKMGGTGLGLAIVNNAVKFHSGNITARIHKSGGLEFVFGWKMK
jgi:two-component system OmpR family sensor kinase/two-component system phosphate regulon sensor histidine kinase PhoR